uniref:general transcription factor IIF subunit 1 n=1 Tax=Ciona intestinalis TaxID=7719 RepID=UPI0000524609|nr:general transcription factor IIF subunit 1 [Ciona intestinalis]|eukprot:XP_002119692.1 general transcription factor IIF subunit 1 [Ciona intestinalis]
MAHVDEYMVRVPKHVPKKYNVMRFNASDKVDIRKWAEATLVRDMRGKKTYEEEEVYPEFGAGSEYGRKQREEARKLKYGMKRKKFVVENQPWNLSAVTPEVDKNDKKKFNKSGDIKPKLVTKDYTGKKEGGIGEGSMYFVFTQRPDFTFEAYPVEDWHNFNRKIQHRTLTDEEAEAAWDKRDKIVNHLNYMARKRLHINDEEAGVNEDETGGKGNIKILKKIKKEENDLVIHDDEDLDMYMSGSSSDSDGGSDSGKKKKKSKTVKKKKEDSENEQEEALEDSDDGEHEGTEVAYASDVSSDQDEEENDSRVAPHGVDELEESSSSDEEEAAKNEKENDKSAGTTKQPKGSDNSGSSEDSASDIDEEESLSKSALFMQRRKTPPKDKGSKGSKSNSRSSTPTAELTGAHSSKSDLQSVKRKLETGRQSPLASSMLGKRGASTSKQDGVSVKRQKTSQASSGKTTPSKDASPHGITEETVKKYLTHKPITTKDLLKKFKKKNVGLSSEQIVEKVAMILRKLNPQKIQTNGKMHLFLRET